MKEELEEVMPDALISNGITVMLEKTDSKDDPHLKI